MGKGIGCMNLIAAGPPSSSTSFDILTTSLGTRPDPPDLVDPARREPLRPVSSNLRVPSYHPRRHLDRQLCDEMHGNRAEALITPIADSSRAPDRTREKPPTFRRLKKGVHPYLLRP